MPTMSQMFSQVSTCHVLPKHFSHYYSQYFHVHCYITSWLKLGTSMLFSVNASLTIWPVPCHVDEDDSSSYHLLGAYYVPSIALVTFSYYNIQSCRQV